MALILPEHRVGVLPGTHCGYRVPGLSHFSGHNAQEPQGCWKCDGRGVRVQRTSSVESTALPFL